MTVKINRKMMRGRFGVLLAASLAIAGTVPAYASPEFSRTAEEWEQLRDNKLEYSEIEGLIEEYNATVAQNNYDYDQFVKDYGKTNSEIADSYRDAADDIESGLSAEDDAQSIASNVSSQAQVKNLRDQADDLLEDSRTKSLGYEMTEKSLVSEAQSKMIAYYKNQITEKELELSYEQAQISLTQVKAKAAAGMATQSDVLDAEEALLNAEKSLSEQKTASETNKNELITMLGWQYGDSPEIGEVPSLDMDEANSVNPASDLEAAIAANYTIRSNEIQLDNAQYQDNRDSISTTIAENKKNVEISLNNAANTVTSAKSAYETAVSQAELAASNLSVGTAKYAAGMITANDYRQLEIAKESADLSVQSAALTIVDAVRAYDWCVKGLASA